MKKFLRRKVKGYIITLELLSAILIWSALMTSTVYVVNNQRWQKLMYTSFCSAATQTAKWGGTNTNIMHVNGRTKDIAVSMEKNINRFYPGTNVDINITPKKVKSSGSDKYITVSLTWTPVNNKWAGPFSRGVASRSHTIRGSFDPIAKPGRLL